jgi:FtsH-binding integral membrane protein
MAMSDRDYAYSRNNNEAVASSFATKVYAWMAVGLALTAILAYGVFKSGLYVTLMPYWWVFAFGTLGIALAVNAMLQKLSVPAMMLLFLAYAALQGVFFGIVLPSYAAAYGGGVIWSAFATAALVYGMAIVYGVFTKSDLTSIGKILTFALIGLIVVTLIYFVLSFFYQLGWLNLVISYIGLVIFVGLTAWDAQKIRAISRQVDSNSLDAYKFALIMALSMYINIIMIFWYLLQIFSASRR